MKNQARAWWAGGAAALVVAYWALDRWLGPFATVRRYGRQGKIDWAYVMPAGEWWWFFACVLVSGAVLLALLAWPRKKVDATLPRRRWPWLVLLAVAAALAVGAVRGFVLDGAPLTDDEMVYRFEAQTLAGGRWTADPPPDAKAFDHIFLGVYRDRWFGQYSFGHPLLLAVGERLGAIGMIGALFTGLQVIFAFLLTRRLFGEKAAWVAAILTAISPLLVTTGATLLSQTTATSLTLLGLWLTLVAADTGRLTHVLAAALALGGAFWCRQQDPAILALGPLALLGWRIARGPSRGALLAGGLFGTALVAIPWLVLHAHLWGNVFWTNYQAYWWGYLKYPGASPFGFGQAPWMNVHTPAIALRSAWQNLARLDLYLLGLPGVLALAGFGLWRHRKQPAVWATFAGVPLTFIVLFFYFWPGVSDTGPQLYHGVGAVLMPFVAAGLVHLLEKYRWPLTALVLVPVAAGVAFWPAHLGALRRAALAGDEIPRLVRDTGVHHALVFTTKYPWAGGHDRCFVLGRPMPRPDLRDDVLFLQTQGTPVDRALAERSFPDRSLWVLRQIDGQIALLPLDEYQGDDSLRLAARPRDLPAP